MEVQVIAFTFQRPFDKPGKQRQRRQAAPLHRLHHQSFYLDPNQKRFLFVLLAPKRRQQRQNQRQPVYRMLPKIIPLPNIATSISARIIISPKRRQRYTQETTNRIRAITMSLPPTRGPNALDVVRRTVEMLLLLLLLVLL